MPRVGSSRMRISGSDEQPAREQHLLLVAARQARERRLERRRPDAQPAEHAPRVAPGRASCRRSRAGSRTAACARGSTFSKTERVGTTPRVAAILGEQRHAQALGVDRRADDRVAAVDADRPRRDRRAGRRWPRRARCAGRRRGRRCPGPRRGAAGTRRPGTSRGCGEVSASTSSSTSPGVDVATRVAVRELAADHARDDLADRQRRRRPRPDHASVAHDRDLVRDGHDLFELVRDVDDRDALGAQVVDESEEPLRPRARRATRSARP